MTNDLASIQTALAEMLRDPASLVGRADKEDLASRIAMGNERLSPTEQVDIYREQFFLRHVDVLREDFKSIEHLLGDDAWDALARAYLAANPPSSYTLRDLGHAMARFVGEKAPWKDDALLADLARVEWAFVDAFDARDVAPLDPNVVANAAEDDWPGARIELHPSVQRLALAYPAHDYRQSVHKGEAPTRPDPQASYVVVYRGPELLHFVDVEADAFAVLDALAEGATLAEACERAAHAEDALAGWFQRWTSLGWVSAVRF